MHNEDDKSENMNVPAGENSGLNHAPQAMPAPVAHVSPAMHEQKEFQELKPMPTDNKPAMMDIMNYNGVESVPVVKTWSIRGIEYAIMTWMLWALAIGTNWVLVAIINGQASFLLLAAPLALLIVSLPIFAMMFMRLKKAELLDPSLRTESTKRRFSQRTQVVAFLVTFFAILTIVASLLAAAGGEREDLGKTIGSALVFVVVWGGLFAYYWNDEHRLVG